ncbi:hypothetical protein V8C86DRAFT_2566829 [Haematococcus lacustris]
MISLAGSIMWRLALVITACTLHVYTAAHKNTMHHACLLWMATLLIAREFAKLAHALVVV